MNLLNEITDDPKQKMTVVTPQGDEFDFYLEFRETQGLWFCNIAFKDTVINGLGLVCGANILRQWKNILPFGLAVGSSDVGDPYYIDDFVNGRIQVFVLTEAEVKATEEEYYGV